MKNRNRKAFTVVELVIVIAVIAILAGVLIPTFSSIVKKAHVSNDTQLATNMTMQLRVFDHDIRTEVELKQAMDAAYGEDYFRNLAPQSADQGYHFWFDIENQTIILATPAKVRELTAQAAAPAKYDFGYATMAEDPMPLAVTPDGFAPGAPRTAIFDGYYLMDRKGSKIAEAISDAEIIGGEKYTGLFAMLVDEKFADYTGINSIKTTVVILTSNGAFGENLEAAIAYISPFVGAIGSGGLDNYPNITIINISNGVVAKEGSLTGQSNITININAPIVDGKLPEVEPNFADSGDKITVNGEGDYYVDGNQLIDRNTGTPVAGLNFAVPVSDFNITVEGAAVNPGESPLYCDSATNVTELYVAVGHAAGIQLTATPTNADASSNLFNWSVSEGPFVIDGTTGILTRKALAEIGDLDSVTVTATPRAGGTAKNITVYLVKPDSASYTLDGNLVGNNLTFALNFDGTKDGFVGAITPIYNYDATAKVEGVTITAALTKTTQKAEEDGVEVDKEVEGIFTVNTENGTITVAESAADKSKTCSMTIKVTCKLSGTELWSKDYIADVSDSSGADFQKKVGESFLFRVGNGNEFTLEYLFENDDAPANIRVEIYDNSDDALIATSAAEDSFYASFDAKNIKAEDWKTQTVRFNGTGVALIKIGKTEDDESTTFVGDPQQLYVEVVNGKNVTAYGDLSSSGNNVLLTDITMSAGGTKSFSNGTLFGNGFTFDVTQGAYQKTANGVASESFVISLNNAVLDNVKIVGKVYTEFNITPSSDYNRAIVLSYGNSGIYNSYISNGAAPVRIYSGNLVIDNTTLKGGSFANLDVQGGNITLRDVTTINQVNGNDKADDGTTPIGLGVAVWYEQVNEATTITVEGTLDQYNFITENQTSYIKNSYAKAFVNKAFTDASIAPYRYNDGTNEWVNTGILSMINTFAADNLKPARINGYGDKITVSASSKTGMLCTVETNASNYTSVPSEWKPTEQEEIAPTYNWDWTSKNYVAKAEGSNDYCYHDGSKVQISMDEGDTKEWDVSILTAEKSGKTLDYSVFMNGVEYTGSTISFSTADDYTIEYVITDSYNYNESGSAYPKEYTKTVEITVSVVKAAAKNATFDFGGNGYDEVTIGNDTYIMPTTGNSITINGTAVKYVLVNCEPSNGQYENSSMSYWNMIYPVFYEVITITDYADGGTGAAVTYGATTTSMPSGLTLAGSSNSSSLPSGAKSFSAETSAGKIFQYSSKGEAATSPTTFKIDNSNRLVYKSPQLSNNGRDEGWMLVRYQYQDNAGKIYYYVVCYHTPTMIEGSGGCVTPDTLVTLADGTQKEIQYVNYNDKLLVWNFYAGKYEVVPSAIIFNMGTGYFDVLTLNFEDGTTVKTIDGHRFFDKTTNAFVLINTINVQDYIGHDFVKVDGDSYTAVKLVDYSIENEYTTSYSIMSAYHYNFIVEGMFSDTFHKEDAPLFDYFQVGDNMMYDADQLQAEIAEYGLYTYEEFADYLTYEQFVALNVQYMKISVEKGQFTYEGILELIEKYLNA